MKIETLKLEMRYLRRSLFTYKKLFSYIYYRFIFAPQIYNRKKAVYEVVSVPQLTIHTLTGHRDAVMAAWSLMSFFNVSKLYGHLIIHNDGTLTKKDVLLFKTLFPSAKIVNVFDFFKRHPTALDMYPTLREFRMTYKKFQSKKLLDVYFSSQTKWILFLDSDMVWFQKPSEIIEAVLEDSFSGSYMMSNGIEVPVEFRDGSSTKRAVSLGNSGITLYRRNAFDLEKMSFYVSKCDFIHKRFTDQACFASILPNLHLLSEKRYIIKGDNLDDYVMKHYTSPVREKFYFQGLKYAADKKLVSYV